MRSASTTPRNDSYIQRRRRPDCENKQNNNNIRKKMYKIKEKKKINKMLNEENMKFNKK